VRVDPKFERLDQRFDLIARGDDMETRPPRSGTFCSLRRVRSR
jgi:hypothetical protein